MLPTPDIACSLEDQLELWREDEAEQKAARRRGIDPAVLVDAAFDLWGHSLTEERDRRLGELYEQLDESATPRTTQARRGHITRQLLKELDPFLKEGR